MPPPTAAWRRDDDGHRRARRPGAGAAESHPDRTHAGIGAMTFTEFLAIVSGLAIGYWLVAVFIPNARKPRKEDAEAAAERDEAPGWGRPPEQPRSEEHTSELQSLMRISYAVFCLKKKKNTN